MHIAILADPAGWYGQDLRRAATSRGHTCTLGNFARVAGAVIGGNQKFLLGADSTDVCDCVIVRSMPPGSLEQVVLRMDLLAQLAAQGTVVSNSPKSLECAIDKYLTTSRLAAEGLPVPDTVCCQTAEQGLEWFERLGNDVVVKPLFGSEGRGIIRVSDTDMAWRVFTAIERIQGTLYLQRFIDHGGCDYRLLVLEGRVLGGMRRRSEHDFRTNVARSGIAEPYAPTPREIELAVQAADVVGTTFAGVDLLYDRAGAAYVIEVNAVPGWKAFARVNTLDVAALYLEALEQRCANSLRARE